jgi:hypothetical protein
MNCKFIKNRKYNYRGDTASDRNGHVKKTNKPVRRQAGKPAAGRIEGCAGAGATMQAHGGKGRPGGRGRTREAVANRKSGGGRKAPEAVKCPSAAVMREQSNRRARKGHDKAKAEPACARGATRRDPVLFSHDRHVLKFSFEGDPPPAIWLGGASQKLKSISERRSRQGVENIA